jgi:hypothetical protein
MHLAGTCIDQTVARFADRTRCRARGEERRRGQRALSRALGWLISSSLSVGAPKQSVLRAFSQRLGRFRRGRFPLPTVSRFGQHLIARRGGTGSIWWSGHGSPSRPPADAASSGSTCCALRQCGAVVSEIATAALASKNSAQLPQPSNGTGKMVSATPGVATAGASAAAAVDAAARCRPPEYRP